MSNDQPAFPGLQYMSGYGCARRVQGLNGDTDWEYHDPGMTLRDYFAAAAINGSLANPESASLPAENLVDYAFEVADLMLERRKKQ